ncbi:MAG TPA: plasmid stabilization protein [Opitutae bacterium]|nr:plasmid stabilization protein [Opitutae bacterium]
MKVEYHKSFERDLRRVRDQNLLDRVEAVLVELEGSEVLDSIANIKAMKGHPDYFRVRIGGFRLGFKRIGGGVRIIRFLSRGDIYRKFP